jgi:SAM domain (Sterile alpha motif)
MSEYADIFAECKIDAPVLRQVTDQYLKDIGVAPEHRRKMLAAISELPGARRSMILWHRRRTAAGGSFLPASAHALLTEKRKLRLQSCLSWTTLWAGGENGSAHPDHFDEATRRIP